MNETLWLIIFITEFSLLLLLYKCMGRTGLFAWVSMATVIANIQVLKTVQLFGFTATLGNVAYASIFLATDILSENYSQKDARTAVILGFVSTLTMTLLMLGSLAFLPSAEDNAHTSMKQLFSLVPRVAAGSAIAYIVSQFYDVWNYGFLKEKAPGTGMLWLRNNLSTLLSQLLDTLVFTTIAFWGLYSRREFTSIVITTFLLKGIAALLDTPFIYLAKLLHTRHLVTER